MKRILTIILAITIAVMMVVGCTSDSTTEQTTEPANQNGEETDATSEEPNDTEENESKDSYVIGVSISGYQAPYFVAMVEAMESKAAELGNVELKVLDAEWDTQKQASQIESLIEQDCDMIQVVPADSTAIMPTLEKVDAAGIPLFIVNTQHDPGSEDVIVTFVGASMEDEAAMAADSMKEYFGDDPCNLVIIEGAAGSFPAIHRTSGFLEAIDGWDNFNILAQQNCGWDRPTAQQTMDDFITRYDDINAVYAHDDNMAIGVIQSLKAANLQDEIAVFSISGTIEGVDAIKAGEMVSTVDQSPTWEGEAAVEYGVRYLEGETLEKWIKTPIAIIDSSNADEFSPAW